MKYSVILLISILFVGCKSDKKDYIRCDEVRTILSFPEEIELTTTVKDYLEENKFVVYNNKDRIYKTPITLTKKGKEVGEYVAKTIDMALEKSGQEITKEDLEILKEHFNSGR